MARVPEWPSTARNNEPFRRARPAAIRPQASAHRFRRALATKQIRYNFIPRFPWKFIPLWHGGGVRNTDGTVLMSMAIAENFIRNAREQHSQQDINASLIKALGEMAREIKRLDDDVRRARRDAQMSRRF